MLVAGCGHPQVRGNNPARPGPPQLVHLIWKQATSTWKVKLDDDPNEQDPKTAETKVAWGVGPTMFQVDIQGGGSSPTFNESNGLTVWTGDKNFPQSGGKTTQILGPVFTKQGNMVFWDLNQGNAVKLNYSLHFNNNIPDADPIIDNGGNS